MTVLHDAIQQFQVDTGHSEPSFFGITKNLLVEWPYLYYGLLHLQEILASALSGDGIPYHHICWGHFGQKFLKSSCSSGQVHFLGLRGGAATLARALSISDLLDALSGPNSVSFLSL